MPCGGPWGPAVIQTLHNTPPERELGKGMFYLIKPTVYKISRKVELSRYVGRKRLVRRLRHPAPQQSVFLPQLALRPSNASISRTLPGRAGELN